MKNTITETTWLLLQGNLTKEEADKILLDLYNVRQSLPKRLSNAAYIQATHKGYDDFMTWWDEQV